MIRHSARPHRRWAAALALIALPLAVAVGRAFAAGEAPEPAGVRSAAAGPVDA